MDSKGNVIDNSHYFEGMKIAEAGECYMNQQGKLSGDITFVKIQQNSRILIWHISV